MGNRYTVHQAVEKTGVKSYVLRYWEEELQLSIGRNELGHRYYTEDDIQLFLKVKELKEKGIQLKAIREQVLPGTCTEQKNVSQEIPGERQIPESRSEPAAAVPKLREKERVSSRSKESPDQKAGHDGKILEFHQILERLIAQEIRMQDLEEGRCRSLDHLIRSHQIARREAAAAADAKSRKKK